MHGEVKLWSRSVGVVRPVAEHKHGHAAIPSLSPLVAASWGVRLTVRARRCVGTVPFCPESRSCDSAEDNLSDPTSWPRMHFGRLPWKKPEAPQQCKRTADKARQRGYTRGGRGSAYVALYYLSVLCAVLSRYSSECPKTPDGSVTSRVYLQRAKPPARVSNLSGPSCCTS
jgi:hypothetical protein